MTVEQLNSLQPALAAFMRRFRVYFKREASFVHCQRYLLGLLANLKRKSIEPIALAAGVAVRTLQEFLQFYVWDHQRIDDTLQRLVMDEHGCEQAIGVIDISAHAKRGDKTPGVNRQWCGETGKVDNCVAGVHLLYTDNDATNPFSCVLDSSLFLPEVWSNDRPRCREAGIPDELVHRPRAAIAVEQIKRAISNGVRFAWLTFDEEFGTNPRFWFALDELGQRAIGEARPNFFCYTKAPRYRSLRREYSAMRVDNVCRHSRLFTNQKWKRIKIKQATRGPVAWDVKTARVRLVDARNPDNNISHPTDRRYWLVVARRPTTSGGGEVKYFISNAPASASLIDLMRVAFARWHIEKWFERAKQEAGFGAFEVRTYTSLIRHWLCSRLAMYFLADQTNRFRGEKPEDHVRTGSASGEQPGLEDLAPLVAVVGRNDRTLRVLPTS